jgi:transcriptional regulator with XRE-family HTH domain
MLSGMTNPITTTPALVLSRNIAAARVRLALDQQDLADRMRALGWKWVRQTVGEVENNRRRLTAEEVLGVAACLDTTIEQLMSPPDRPGSPVELPSGAMLMPGQVRALVSDTYNGPYNRSIRWSGNTFEQAPESIEAVRLYMDGKAAARWYTTDGHEGEL